MRAKTSEKITFRVLDLFSGAGGFSCGINMNKNFSTLVANDFNEPALETFKKNKKDCLCIYGDITKTEIKDRIIHFSKEKNINMIIGGPPCQGFSLKGKKLGLNDERNFLFKEFVEMVSKIRPEVFVMENVKNMVNASNGFFINELINKMETLGYKVSFKVINAKNFSIPQNRERVIIIGSRSIKIDLNNIFSKDKKNVTVYDAISDLDYLSSGEGTFESFYVKKPRTAYQRQLRLNSKKLYNHISTKHSKIVIEKLKLIPAECGKEFLPKSMIGKQKFNTTWSRLEWNKISPTIDTRFDTPSNGKNSHPFLNRSITPREAARIQSFPDNFIFYGSKTEICKQIGNAVPPLMAKAIADKILDEYVRNGITKK